MIKTYFNKKMAFLPIFSDDTDFNSYFGQELCNRISLSNMFFNIDNLFRKLTNNYDMLVNKVLFGEWRYQQNNI